MSFSVATISIESISPLSQSRYHEAPKLSKELSADYDRRTWKEHLHTDNEGFVTIPAHAYQQALIAAAKYSKKQIPGQGKATWTAKFSSGILMFDGDLRTNVRAEDVSYIDIFANADGVRGSGKRVMRRFPQIFEWKAQTEIGILDEIITEDIFKEIVYIAGMFVGLGRFRPEKGGTNGRFRLRECNWQDNREMENVLANSA